METPESVQRSEDLPEPVQLFGAKIHPMTMDQTVSTIVTRVERGAFTQHGVVNVAKLVTMQNDRTLMEAVRSCDVVNADGAGIVWGARFLGRNLPERVAGIDLFEALLAAAEETGYSVYLLGATREVLATLLTVVGRRHPGLIIAGAHHGYFQGHEDEVVDEIARSRADLLFVGISSPFKENFIDRWRDRLGVTFVMGVGGAFDILAGKTRRAPGWMQDNGLEWVYRLVQEPRRMWRRYLVTNTLFAWMLLKSRLSGDSE